MTARPHANDPTRVLVLTGSVGAGHDAAAAAVAERVAARWPDASAPVVDVLGGSATSERIYAACVRTLPWLYALHHWLLGHVPVFRAGTRAVLGRLHARAVAAALRDHAPDLVVTTVPEGVQALAHLRRRGRVAAPVVVVLADPAPHPLWCDADLDLHLVTTPEAARRVARHAPGARVGLAEVPVAAARRGVPAVGGHAGRRVFVTTGSLGFGDLPAIVAAVRAAGAEVVTAHADPTVRGRLAGPGVEVHAWIDDPAAVLGAVDAVVTTGGGASCFEALAAGVPLLVVDPVPGHGRANALVLARAGLARYCRTTAELTTALRGDLPAAHVGTAPDLAAAIAPVVGTARAPLRAEDALFLDAATGTVPQVLGARIVVAAGPEVDWPALLAGRVRDRAAGLDLLARRLVGRTWVPVVPDPADHVVPTRATDPDDLATEVLTAPVDPRGVGWRLAAATTGGETTIVAAVHHALGDGLAVTDALVRLLTDESAALPTSARTGAGDPHPPAVGSLRGVVALASRGFAGSRPFPAGNARGVHHVGRVWDAATIRRTARAHGTSTTVVVLTVLAEALSGTGAPTIRAMVPLTTRLRGAAWSAAAGNRTAAVAIDLPTAPLSPADRLARVASTLEAARRSGQADGAVAVLAVLGRLPAGVQHAFARLTYRSAFFHLLTSVMPGVRRPLHVAGGRIRQVVPILPLAPGVGLAFGAIAWADTLGVGITLDDAVVDPALDVPARVGAALARLCGPAARRGTEDRGLAPTGRSAR
ncbi:WS/DGAT domain-containing protein [Actinomycetospora chiangmaiensis]|uniref:WS/DGAT domain-containing protein n=1 Tax=Actinomycetospora chiangmaiensis TaxID=402650 RepID=UPI00036E81CF|nr:WS/DGAT domain-containing protein [Actinomycetospora chiangmaiensis]